MRRRTRLIGGIFALVAMTFVLAETVVASTCAPGMGMRLRGAEAMPENAADDCMPGGLHDQEGSGGGDERRCPFGPAAAAHGCTAAASLPAPAASAIAVSSEFVIADLGEQTRSHLWLADALFHPPRH